MSTAYDFLGTHVAIWDSSHARFYQPRLDRCGINGGSLQTVTVQRDDSGNAPDCRLDSISVNSYRMQSTRLLAIILVQANMDIKFSLLCNI